VSLLDIPTEEARSETYLMQKPVQRWGNEWCSNQNWLSWSRLIGGLCHC